MTQIGMICVRLRGVLTDGGSVGDGAGAATVLEAKLSSSSFAAA